MSPAPAVVFPAWLTKLIISALVTALIGGWVAWEGKMSARSHDHETRISVVEEHNKGVDKSLDEIKAGQLRIEDKLDRALRRPH